MTPEKIRAIKRYLSTQGVKYYDVQAELIDHFATAVEEAERENPNIPFKHALIQAHRAFGGREGFRKYLDAAKKDVRKKTNRIILNLLLQFLHWPFLLITVLVIASWHFFFNNFQNIDPRTLYLLMMVIGVTIIGGLNNYRLRNIPMFMPRHANITLGGILYFIIFLPSQHLLRIDNPSHQLLVAYFSLLTFLLISFARLPKLAIAETLKKYPQIA